jgi:hypothetical protein
LGETAHWQSTPLNYLEKIFQIPFALQAMNPGGFKSIVGELTQPIVHTDPESPIDNADFPPGPGNGATREDAPNGTAPSRNGPAGLEEPPDARKEKTRAIVNPERLRLEQHEQTFMKELASLIETPRAAKRFVNIYRLLRASLDDEELFVLTGDRAQPSLYYQPVLLMLAILTGYPTEGATLLQDLVLNAQHKQYLWDLMAPPQEADTKNGALRMVELAGKLRALRPAESGEQYLCANLKDWALRVSRYSFESGQIVR